MQWANRERKPCYHVVTADFLEVAVNLLHAHGPYTLLVDLRDTQRPDCNFSDFLMYYSVVT